VVAPIAKEILTIEEMKCTPKVLCPTFWDHFKAAGFLSVLKSYFYKLTSTQAISHYKSIGKRRSERKPMFPLLHLTLFVNRIILLNRVEVIESFMLYL